MKILDKYILVSYLKTFISVFVILMFIFVLQTIWLYISELAGKDLDLAIIMRFLLYFSPKLIPLVLPLTILVSSIMVFGKFAENYEFAAMKSTGISLQRAMRSLTVFIILLSGTAFFFANNVIPWSEYKSLNLRRNIAQLKPAIIIAEGQFSEVGDITIKVGKKRGDRGQYLEDVIIHKNNPQRAGNYTVIKANNGELIGTEGSNLLSLILKDGNYYDEILQQDPHKQLRRPFAKSYFEEYTINIDLSEFNNIDLEAEQGVSNEKMYRISELRYELDSLSKNYSNDMKVFSDAIYFRSGVSTLSSGFKPAAEQSQSTVSVLDVYSEVEQQNILGLASENVRTSINAIEAKKVDLQNKRKRLIKYEMALHDKYVIAFACIILFFVGAPLGAIIRKGGMGLPMVIAICIFLAYHFIGIFAKNSAENGKLMPFLASWFSTFIMLPIGIWLTYRATTDQGFFDLDSITQPVSNFFKRKFKRLKKTPLGETTIEDIDEEDPLTNEELIILQEYETSKLIDIVKNYHQYGYSNQYKEGALKILAERGITKDDLQASGNLYNKDFIEAELLTEKLKVNMKVATVAFIGTILLPILLNIVWALKLTHMVFEVIPFLIFITFIIFYIYLYKTIRGFTEINRIVNNKDQSWTYILLLLGFPFYILFYFYFRQKIKEYIKLLK